MDMNKQSRTKEKIAKVTNEDLINSFNPRTYPETFKSIMLSN